MLCWNLDVKSSAIHPPPIEVEDFLRIMLNHLTAFVITPPLAIKMGR